ncbi:MAG TPA: ferric reductase-like transmembrane domain-containing protein [Acidimicrobiales bacterium]|nr:ferric reductase-like transmembrane domain-containing protein [Acidimicrobiales bacterium]
MSGTLPWYVARASGLVAWALLAGSVVWGLLMTSKLMRRRVKNAWLLDLHRWLGGLALVFTGVHILAIMGDTYVHFGLASVLVPFASHWHPLAVAWGVASLYLLAAVELTSLARRHLSHRLWRRVHFLSFPLFVFSTIHGLSAGTDSARPMAIIAVALGAIAVALLTSVRLKARADGSGRSRLAGQATRPTNRPATRSANRPTNAPATARTPAEPPVLVR